MAKFIQDSYWICCWKEHCRVNPVSHLGQSESVRDVQFSMKDYFTFAASFENGNVQLWDIRRPDRYERMFTAHTGPVFCCDWHPDDRYKKKEKLLVFLNKQAQDFRPFSLKLSILILFVTSYFEIVLS